MAFIRSGKCAGGGGTLKDVYRDIVINNPNGFTSYSLAPYSGRVTIAEGSVVVDETNHTVYVYADYTVNSNQPTTSAYSMMTITGFSTNLMPYVYSSTSLVRGYATLTTDDSSTNSTKSLVVFNSSGTPSILRASGQGATANDHYIIYGSWKY